MWWPAIGAVAVGLAGLAAPRTLGVGYDNIVDLLGGSLAGRAAFTLCGLKLVSWAVSLGSGTSGGTLAPLLTVGGGMGTILGATAAALVPSLGVDPRMGALVGMAAMFTGASRALLASVVFAFEATRQSVGLMPLLGGSAAAYLVAALLQRQSIMTERIARRGLHVPEEYAADHLDLVAAREVGARRVVTLEASSTLDAVRSWIASGAPGASHQGFPVVDAAGLLVGVVTRRDLFDASRPGTASIGALVRRPPVVVFADQSLRIAADHMAHEGIGRLPVVARDAPRVLVGIITRSDVLGAHLRRLHRATRATQVIELGRSLANGRRGPPSTRAPEPASG
jgi:CBS domain-containing protein